MIENYRLKSGDLVTYRARLLGNVYLAIVLKEMDMGPTDYSFYKILLSDGKLEIVADTRLTYIQI